MDQLRRETQPPAGTPPSPVPQYWNPDTEKYERVLGVHGAPRAMLHGPNGQPISTSNRLPVDVGAQVATESTLAEAVSRLNAILTRLEGTLNVDVGGQIHADVDLGDVTVQIGEVQQGKRGQNAEPWEVTLSGSTVELARSGRDVVIGAGVSLVVLGSGGPVELEGVKEIRGIVRRVSGASLSSLTVKIGWHTGFRVAWESNVSLVINQTNWAYSRLPVDSDDTKAHSRVLSYLSIVNNSEANDITVDYLFMGVC